MTPRGKPKNQLFYGDNLFVLREHVADESIDLVYLDPPFNSNTSYNVLFKEHGTDAASQIQAFEDTWRWDEHAAQAYHETVEGGGKLSETLQAFRKIAGETDILAYLSMMAPRLAELQRVLKPTGSIYLHCDPTAGHYLKLLMDAVFSPENFRNEIIWYYYNKLHDSRKKLFSRASDTIFFYTKNVEAAFTFHQLKELRDEPVRQLKQKKLKGKIVNVKDEKGHVVYQMKADRTIDNVWRIPCLQPASTERLGYPTQKPIAVLERILKASSDEGDVVLDPFCGCGTTIDAAQKLGRQWIGIDITHLAINLIKHRLQDTYGSEINKAYEVIGEPTSVPDARILAGADPYQFQWWALGLVGARPVDQKKGADRGIDGRIYFHEGDGVTKQVILSVKGGKNVTVKDVRDLKAVVEREGAAIGVMLLMHPATKPMRAEAADSGNYQSPWAKHPKVQILTIRELLEGKRIDMPKITGANVTFRKAAKHDSGGSDEGQLTIREEPGEYGAG